MLYARVRPARHQVPPAHGGRGVCAHERRATLAFQRQAAGPVDQRGTGRGDPLPHRTRRGRRSTVEGPTRTPRPAPGAERGTGRLRPTPPGLRLTRAVRRRSEFWGEQGPAAVTGGPARRARAERHEAGTGERRTPEGGREVGRWRVV